MPSFSWKAIDGKALWSAKPYDLYHIVWIFQQPCDHSQTCCNPRGELRPSEPINPNKLLRTSAGVSGQGMKVQTQMYGDQGGQLVVYWSSTTIYVHEPLCTAGRGSLGQKRRSKPLQSLGFWGLRSRCFEGETNDTRSLNQWGIQLRAFCLEDLRCNLDCGSHPDEPNDEGWKQCDWSWLVIVWATTWFTSRNSWPHQTIAYLSWFNEQCVKIIMDVDTWGTVWGGFVWIPLSHVCSSAPLHVWWG